MKQALITGAASGLGQAVAEALAREGWRLTLWDLNQAGLAQTASLCGAAEVATAQLNLADNAAVTAALDGLAAAGKAPELVFHAAGVLDVGDLDALTVEACRRDVEVNYLGTVHLLLGARRVMAPGGRIICVSSIAGLKGMPEFSAYCGSKFAVFGFCEAVHGDFARRGIALSVLCPPAVNTPMVQNLASRPVLYDLFPFAEKEAVVKSVVKAIGQRGEFLILVDAQSRLLYRLNGLAPRVTSTVLENLVQWKRKRARA